MEDTNPKTQHGLKKAQHHLTPTTALEEMAGAFELGAKKYGAFNWREKTVSASTYVSAAKRHIDAWWERQEVDPESGRHHLGHALACLAILIDAQKFKNIVDDRPKVGLHNRGRMVILGAPVADYLIEEAKEFLRANGTT
jgi:hypothetical protein